MDLNIGSCQIKNQKCINLLLKANTYQLKQQSLFFQQKQI